MSLDTPGRVYVVTNPAWPEWLKVGFCEGSPEFSKNSLRRRLIQFNVGDPLKGYRVEADSYAACAVTAERYAHTLLEIEHLRGGGEWFRCSVEIAQQIVERVCSIARVHPKTRDSRFKEVLEELRNNMTEKNETQEINSEDLVNAVPTNSLDSEEVRATAKAAHGVIFDLLECMAMGDPRLEAAADAVLRRLVRLGTSS